MESIYVGHSRSIDYKNEFYPAIKNTLFYQNYNVILPHDKSEEPFPSKTTLPKCRLMLAEVSQASAGLGIELGWADMLGVEIICLYKKGSKRSASLDVICTRFIEYSDYTELVKKLNYLFLEIENK